MPVDFSQVQQKLVEKFQSQLADATPELKEADVEKVAKFQDMMVSSAEQSGAQSGQANVEPPPLDNSDTRSLGDRILDNMTSMSQHAHQIEQVATKVSATGGDAGNMLHTQMEMAKITATTSTATDAVNKSSQDTDTLLKS